MHFSYRVGISSIALSCFEKNVILGDAQQALRTALAAANIWHHWVTSLSENKASFWSCGSGGAAASNKLSAMYSTFFVLALFLWYFWYFYWTLGAPVPRPEHGSPHRAAAYWPQFEYSSHQDKFRFKVHHRVVWEHRVPEPFTFHQQRLVAQDACHNVPDGGKVAATGFALYEYLRDHPQLQPPHFQKDTAPSVVRKGHVFYFTCRGKRIWRLGQCPSGQTWVGKACTAVTPCTEQEDGVLLPVSPHDKSRYLRCEGGSAHLETCPLDTFFLLDACRSQKDLSYYCQFSGDSFFVEGFQTRIDCVHGRPVYTRCPDGSQFFDEHSECEPVTCHGRSDGTLVSSGPAFDDGTFTYFTGYRQCVGGRLALQSTDCPTSWEFRDPSNRDNLLQLPMVFDGEKCAIPTFCVNVQPVDRDAVVVPVYEWRRHVAHWHRAFQYDHLEGYQCDAKPSDPGDPLSRRKRVRMDPGDTIHPKRFRRTDGCSSDALLPVPGSSDRYFDCRHQTVVPCPPGQRFNGTACGDPLPHPFRYQGRDLFQLDSLSHDNWIVPWKYVPKGSPAVQCATAEERVNLLYNLCSHPDCERYPYLSQLPPFSIYHREGYRCFFDPSDRRLKKEEAVVPASFDFWTQQKASGPCEPGQRLKTGHFVWDRLFFATCHPDQPFVFCPSSETDGIVQVRGPSTERYACRLPVSKHESSVLGRANETTTAHFELNEIARIHPTLPDQEVRLKADGGWTRLPKEGKAIDSALDLTVQAPLVLEHRYRVTHPPDVVFHHQEHYKVSAKGGGFLCRRADFTQRALTFPVYSVQSFASDFMR